ncbi:MAG TPA: ABC transporter ATP-binding protein [Streptosporangiaceae bacterium]|nr:ABC transporter ATP-binding protein [Streptosporangiaceae bacterium]
MKKDPTAAAGQPASPAEGTPGSARTNTEPVRPDSGPARPDPGPGGTAAVPALVARGITKRFPGVVANNRVGFEVLPGEIHALLGENGAGKTTLCNVLTGLYQPDEGHVEMGGEPRRFRSPRDAHEAGIFMVHQHFRLVQPLSVAENMILGWSRERGTWFSPHRVEREVAKIAEQFQMPIDPHAKIWQLSVGEQQRVEILKALYRGARILILDEPTTVLTPQEVQQLFATLRGMAATGTSVVFISHKLPEVLGISDRVTVLRAGAAVGTVRTADSDARSLARLMVGRDIVLARQERAARNHPGEAVLDLACVSAMGDLGTQALADVSLQVRAGEIVGVAGVAGNGQRELAEVVAGERPATAGTVTIAGRPQHGTPWEAIDAGLGYVPEERMGVGVAPGLTIADNLILKSYRENGHGPILHAKQTAQHATELIQRFGIVARGPKTIARELSGGNIQRLLLARELSGHPKILIAASPTRGLDVAATESVRRLLTESADRGIGVLLISEDLDEILDLSDRIAVMYRGQVVGVVDRDGADVNQIGLMMAGVAS